MMYLYEPEEICKGNYFHVLILAEFMILYGRFCIIKLPERA